jgi:NAD dependent epimerase/dehydratase family enzyme
MSWLSLDDLVEMYLRAVEDPALSGPVNAVAPEAVDNRSFGRTLGRVLGRPAFLPLPGFAVTALFGEMGRETLLADLALRPEALQRLGHGWRQPGLEDALRHCLGRVEDGS